MFKMAMTTNNWTTLTLFTTQDKFYLQPNETTSEVLVLDRINRTIDIQKDLTKGLPSDTIGRHVYGIFGIVRLIAGPYLIVITRVDRMGELNGQVIYRIADMEIIPFSPHPTSPLTEKQSEYNATYLSMIKSTLDTPNFYFSYSYDLTRPLQWSYTQDGGPNLTANSSIWSRADPLYTWNSHLLHDISAREELIKFCIPVIHGFVSINNTQVNSRPVKWSLVSRRAVTRAGCRLLRRGLDEQGHVANQVLTEQIIECGQGRSSLVQLRGSIPLYWHQTPNLKYKPPPVPLYGMDHLTGFSRHLDALIETHGRIHIISLIDHKGKEAALNKLLNETVTSYDSGALKYESFDFHHECRKMRWDRLSILIDRIRQDVLQEYGYFMVTSDSSMVVNYQEGVVRTNCIDSLDRTNVVQSLVAQISLENQLSRFGIISSAQNITQFDSFYSLYRNVWADHADAISVQYSGTPALKTDFTRTGKRTRAGLMQDGINSLTRYYKNNFTDGFRQDGIDLLLGNYRIQEAEGTQALRCPLEDNKSFRTMALPILLVGSVAMFFLTLILPAESRLETGLFMLFWAGLVGLSGMGILHWGKDFVDFPRLTSHYLIMPAKGGSGTQGESGSGALNNSTPMHVPLLHDANAGSGRTSKLE